MDNRNTLEQKIIDLDDSNLESIEKNIWSANNVKELFDIMKFIKSLNLNFESEKLFLKYMWFLAAVFVILWLIFIVVLSQTPLCIESFTVVKYYFFFFFGIMFVGIVYGSRISKKASHTKYISNSIILKKVALDNNFGSDEKDKKELLQYVEDKFFIFKLGNHSRQLIRYIKGEYQNKFVYHYFHFQYVDVHSSRSTDADGEETTNKKYKSYDLYGVIIPFKVKALIKISSYKDNPIFIQWKTASISFNKKFKVYTDHEQAVALFLQPKVIEQIEKLYETFPQLDLEISPEGLLALSTPDQQLLNYTRKYGVDQIDLFANEIQQTLDQTKLYKALEFINFLTEYHQQT